MALKHFSLLSGFVSLAPMLLLAACGSDDEGSGTTDDPTMTGGTGGAGAGGTGTGAGGAFTPAQSDGLALGQQYPWPTNEWTIADPAEVGMDAAMLQAACDYAMNFDGNADGSPDTNTQGVVIIRGGAIVHECYAQAGQFRDLNGGPVPAVDKGPDDYATSWSAAKSFVSTLVGIAIDEGLIESVDVPMSTFFPEWANDERANITLKNVLQMQSGLKFIEEYVDLSSEIVQLFNANDGNQFARSLSYERAPESNWYYSSGDSQLLGAAVLVLLERGLPAPRRRRGRRRRSPRR